MIRHIVMWRLKPECKHEAELMQKRLMDLTYKIPVIKRIEVGINQLPGEQSADIVLYSEFASYQDLQTYQDHADHQAVAGFVREIAAERRVVDYEV